MAKINDILIDDTGDLLIKDGDFVIGPALETQIEHLMLADKGAYRDDPLAGAGIKRTINGRLNTKTDILREIKLQLQGDGWQNIDVRLFQDQDLTINADRT